MPALATLAFFSSTTGRWFQSSTSSGRCWNASSDACSCAGDSGRCAKSIEESSCRPVSATTTRARTSSFSSFRHPRSSSITLFLTLSTRPANCPSASTAAARTHASSRMMRL